jgi:hypothetical protein
MLAVPIAQNRFVLALEQMCDFATPMVKSSYRVLPDPVDDAIDVFW